MRKKMRKEMMFLLVVMLRLSTFDTINVQTQMIHPNDCSFKYIEVVSHEMNIKLMDEAVNFKRTKNGSTALGQSVTRRIEKVKRIRSAVKVEKLKMRTNMHCEAVQPPIKRLKNQGSLKHCY